MADETNDVDVDVDMADAADTEVKLNLERDCHPNGGSWPLSHTSRFPFLLDSTRLGHAISPHLRASQVVLRLSLDLRSRNGMLWPCGVGTFVRIRYVGYAAQGNSSGMPNIQAGLETTTKTIAHSPFHVPVIPVRHLPQFLERTFD